MLADGGVEVGLDDARLHAGQPGVGVDRHDRVEPRDVDDARADRLAGEAGAGARMVIGVPVSRQASSVSAMSSIAPAMTTPCGTIR